MRIGVRSHIVTIGLAVAISFIAKDLAIPLLGVALFGLFDRLIGQPMLRLRG
jgi:hypothetical protein